MPLEHVRQGYLAGRTRMAVTKRLWSRGTFSDIEEGMRMAAIMHAWGYRTLPDWPCDSDGWPAELMQKWLRICLGPHTPAIAKALAA